MSNKLVLGTAQFGMDYGVNNKRGKIPQLEVFDILNKAIECGIDIFDTASSYGDSEKIIGEYARTGKKKLKLISKLPECKQDEVGKIFARSLSMLNVSNVYGYLVHSFESFKNNRKIWSELESLKKEGKIKKLGFSLYLPSELEFIFNNNLKIDMVQFPFSVFDNRFEPYFHELKKRKVEIYVRSVFLQGIVFKRPAMLSNNFDVIKDKIKKLNNFSKKSNVSVLALCLNFAAKNDLIDKIVVGIDNIQHFEQIMYAMDLSPTLKTAISQMPDLRIDDENVILPSKWAL